MRERPLSLPHPRCLLQPELPQTATVSYSPRSMVGAMNRTWACFMSRRSIRTGLLAGLAGGLAEILWVGFYAADGSADAGAVAFEVGRTLLPTLAPSQSAIWLGVAVHMVLAAGLGVLFLSALRIAGSRISSPVLVAGAALAFGAGIWAVNFLLLLPRLNPDFVILLPYGVTLVSKLLFGLGLASGLLAQGRTEFARAPHALTRRQAET